MDSSFAQKFDFGVRMVSTIATLSITAIVATITKAQLKTNRDQWKTNQEKLRLDLYGKRFEIYMRTLDFYTALLGWKDEQEQVALIAPFYRAYRESKFLFPEAAGVHRFLEEFSQHAFQITNFKEARDGWGEAFPEETVALALARTDHVNWVLTSIAVLEERIAPFLNFHSI
jgi:hypothetical protein